MDIGEIILLALQQEKLFDQPSSSVCVCVMHMDCIQYRYKHIDKLLETMTDTEMHFGLLCIWLNIFGIFFIPTLHKFVQNPLSSTSEIVVECVCL